MHARMNPKDLENLFGIEIPSFDGCFGKGKDGITDKQRTFIHKLGLNITGLRYKAQASIVIDTVIKRSNDGLATVKQLQTIRNLKLKTDKPLQNITRDEATELISKYLW